MNNSTLNKFQNQIKKYLVALFEKCLEINTFSLDALYIFQKKITFGSLFSTEQRFFTIQRSHYDQMTLKTSSKSFKIFTVSQL